MKQAWLADQKAKAVKQAYDEMRAKYTILMPAPPPEGAPDAAALARTQGKSTVNMIPSYMELPQ